MTISAESIATAIARVSPVSLGWKETGDLRKEFHLACNRMTAGLRQEIQPARNDVANLANALATWNSAWPDWKAGYRVDLQRKRSPGQSPAIRH